MASTTRRGSRVQCPVCLRRQSARSHQLLCANCNNDKVEALRNSCLANDDVNARNRSNINAVFAVCRGVLESGRDDAETLENLLRQMEVSKPKDAPSVASVKNLALQLLKMELINGKILVRNIERSRDSAQLKVIGLNEQIVDVETSIEKLAQQVAEFRAKMEAQTMARMTQVAREYSQLNNENIARVEKQSLSLQLTHFRILKQICFSSGKSSWAKTSGLLLFGQPVLRIEQFFSFNSKLLQLNGYLENLILLQDQLARVFGVALPYLEELRAYLPDAEFYGLVQKKENFMVNGGELEEEAPEVEPVEDEAPNERIIKLGNTIKLPLSSTTINNQLRRKSQTRPEPVPEAEPPKKMAPNKLVGRKMVIVPHKLLTKPFTKLSSKEYLKFLSVVVKILVNFKVLFAYTADTVPRSASFTSSLASTVHQLRKPDDKDYGAYNLEKILYKVRSLDEYLSHQMAHQNEPKAEPESLLQSQVSTPSTSSSPLLSYVQDSGEWRDARNYRPESGLRALYGMFAPRAPAPQDVYGVFSEAPPAAGSDLKGIMQDVHTLMMGGAKTAGTASMTAASRQLDDWDVVSRMYA